MPGILDFLSQGDNPLGLALLAAGGPTTDPNQSGFGQRIAGAVGSATAQRRAQQEAALRARYVQSQITENDAQAGFQQQQLADAQRKQALAERAYTDAFGGSSSAGATPGSGGITVGQPTAGGVGAGGRGIANMTPDQVWALRAAGLPDATALWTAANDKVEVAPGLWMRKSEIPTGGVNQAAVDARRADRIDQRNINAGGEIVTLNRPDGSTIQVPKTALLAGGGAPTASAPVSTPRPAPPMIGNFGGPTNSSERGMAAQVAEPMGFDAAAARRELAKNDEDLATKPLDPKSRQMLEAYGAELRQKLAASGGAPAVAPAASPAQPLIGTFGGGVVGSTMPRAQQDQADVRKAEEMARAQERVAEETAPKKAAREVAAFTAKERAKTDISNASAADNLIASADDAIKVIDQALAHPGFKAGTGSSSVLDPRNYIAGTDAYNFGQRVEQIKGKAFLTAFQNLKGGGAISEKEGEKATNAIARLNQKQSPAEFAQALKDLKEVVDRGRQNAVRMKGQGPGAAGDAAAKPGSASVDDLLKKYGR